MSDRTFEKMVGLLGERRRGVVAEDDRLDHYAETVAESLFAKGGGPAPDCLRCGACCAYFQQIPISVADPTPRMLTWMVWEAGDRAGPKMHWLRREPAEGQCVALEGEVGQRACCAIYELRPAACREFEAGSDRCYAVRRLYGLEPQLSQTERAEHARLLGDPETGDFLADRPALFNEVDKIIVLRELIDYNSRKIEEILIAIRRLLGVFDDRRVKRGQANCARALKQIEKDARMIADEMTLLTAPAGIETLERRELYLLSAQLLRVGGASQMALERGSARLAALGRLAFEILGMKAVSYGEEKED